jgi:DNA polymerase-3 subunit delta
VVLVRGPAEYLRERAVAGLLALARQRDPEIERVVLAGPEYVAGAVLSATSPSLFSASKVVEITGAEQCTDALVTDMVEYVKAPFGDAVVILVHGGGVRGKRMLDAVRKSGAPEIVCEVPQWDAGEVFKADFVTGEFRAAKRKVAPEAVSALVEALGSDLRELASAAAQLVADTEGTVTAEVVDRYYGGRVQATGFRVADAAVIGDVGQAVALLRHALDVGVDPVPLVAALASKMRQVAKVSDLRGTGKRPQDVGLAPFIARKIGEQSRGWTDAGIAAAIEAVAAADADVKGGARDPIYAVEKAVLTVAARGLR